MSEIKTKIEVLRNESGDEYFIISPSHTIADIARWLIDQDWNSEIAYFLDNTDEL